MSEQHGALVNTPKQLIVVCVLALVIPVAIALLGAQLLSGSKHIDRSEPKKLVEQRIKPVGELLKFDGAPPPAAAAVVAVVAKAKSGEEVYNGACVACHGAARVPWLRAHLKRTDDLTLQLGRERFGMFRDAVCLLAASGYAWIGADHFVRADDALVLAADDGRLSRTGMGYTMRAGTNMLGLGTGAMSELNGWCVQNTADPVAWQRAVGARQLPLEQGHVRSPDDTDRAAAITHLLCNAELPYDLFLGDMYELVDRFEEFAADGLVEFQSERVVVTPLGRFFLRALCGTLDAYRVALDLPVRYSHAV